MSTPNAEQIQLARSLADPDKAVRFDTVAALDAKLAHAETMTELDMLKLWKALYYTMWLCDKAPIQAELAESLSKLTFSFSKPEQVVLFHRIFYRTVLREWLSLDQHRVNKFYVFIRTMTRYVFTYLARNDWSLATTNAVLQGLEDEILLKTPNGVRFHMADIYLEELLKATNGVITTKSFLLCINPFLRMIKSCKEQLFHDRIASSIFKKFLTKYSSECSIRDAQLDKEKVTADPALVPVQSEAPLYFKSVKTRALQKIVFDIASAEDTSEHNRKKVYAIHKEFYPVTGAQFIEEDDTGDSTLATVEKIEDTTTSTTKKAKVKPGVDKSAEKATPVAAESPRSVVLDTSAKSKPTSSAPAPVARSQSDGDLESSQQKTNKKRKAVVVTEESPVVAAAASKDSSSTKAADGANKVPASGKKTKSAESEAPVDAKPTKSALKSSGATTAPSSGALDPFIPSKSFSGQKIGYVFQMGAKGLGYYVDSYQQRPKSALAKGRSGPASAVASSSPKKSVKFGANKTHKL